MRIAELMGVCVERGGDEFPVMDEDVLRVTLPADWAALVREAARREQVSPAVFAVRALPSGMPVSNCVAWPCRFLS